MGPLDYTMDVLNPIEGYMQGLKFGEGILTDRLNRDATTHTMGIQRENMDLAQSQFAALERERAQQAQAAAAQTEAARARAEALKATLMSAYDGIENGDLTPGQILRISLENPEIAAELQAGLSFFGEERAAVEADRAKQFIFALNQGKPEVVRSELQVLQEAAEAAGDKQGSDTYKGLIMSLDADPTAFQLQQMLALSALIPNDEFKQYTSIIGYGADPDNNVRASEILEDGTVVQSTDTGTKVYNPQGELVTGQAAADAVAAAQEQRVQNESNIAGARVKGANEAEIETGGGAAGAVKLGQLSMDAGVQAFTDIAKVNSSISNINEAISAIDDGAAAGIVYNMLPNVTEASASLNNAMNRMGLDVIGSVTFGALSEAEMKLAMDTAVPRDLRPAELREWLTKKRAAQEKAREALTAAASYLTVPGNTINGWLEKQGESGGDMDDDAFLRSLGLEP